MTRHRCHGRLGLAPRSPCGRRSRRSRPCATSGHRQRRSRLEATDRHRHGDHRRRCRCPRRGLSGPASRWSASAPWPCSSASRCSVRCWPVRSHGVIGAAAAACGAPRAQLARENAMRNPKRTAATASALMIGVALVGFITIFAASTKASIRAASIARCTADYIVDSGVFDARRALACTSTAALSAHPELAAVTGLRIDARRRSTVAQHARGGRRDDGQPDRRPRDRDR